MIITDFYPEIESACHVLNILVLPVLNDIAKELGLTVREANCLLTIPAFEPSPVNAAIFRVGSPYTAASIFEECLKSLHLHHYLELTSGRNYLMTKTGLGAVDTINQTKYASISSIQTLQTLELNELNERLKRLSDACARAAEPPGHWSIQHTRRLDPGRTAPLMVQVHQHLTELTAYRDDAHLSSWQGLIEDGHAWDILTLLWTGKDFAVEKINHALLRRGNSLEQTKKSIVKLYKKGWVDIEGFNVRISTSGLTIRNEAEEKTNQAYYAPFGTFSDYELERTYELLVKHRREIPAL